MSDTKTGFIKELIDANKQLYIAGAILVVVAYATYRNSIQRDVNVNKIGHLKIMAGESMSKNITSNYFEKNDNESKIYEGDTLYTKEKSKMLVTLIDGEQFETSENTIIEFQKNKKAIKLINGKIRVLKLTPNITLLDKSDNVIKPNVGDFIEIKNSESIAIKTKTESRPRIKPKLSTFKIIKHPESEYVVMPNESIESFLSWETNDQSELKIYLYKENILQKVYEEINNKKEVKMHITEPGEYLTEIKKNEKIIYTETFQVKLSPSQKLFQQENIYYNINEIPKLLSALESSDDVILKDGNKSKVISPSAFENILKKSPPKELNRVTIERKKYSKNFAEDYVFIKKSNLLHQSNIIISPFNLPYRYNFTVSNGLRKIIINDRTYDVDKRSQVELIKNDISEECFTVRQNESVKIENENKICIRIQPPKMQEYKIILRNLDENYTQFYADLGAIKCNVDEVYGITNRENIYTDTMKHTIIKNKIKVDVKKYPFAKYKCMNEYGIIEFKKPISLKEELK